MRLLISLLLAYPLLGDASPWQEILSSLGFMKDGGRVVVTPSGTSSDWTARVERGTILILEGESPLAAAFGFRPSSAPHVTVRSVEDLRAPKLRIIWEKALDLPVFDMPAGARIFARERHQGSPLMAGFRRGLGAVFWVAAPPGPHGYER